jgi:hypothetical protein
MSYKKEDRAGRRELGDWRQEAEDRGPGAKRDEKTKRLRG